MRKLSQAAARALTAGREMRLRRLKKTVEERFWARVDKTGGRAACWPWLGAKRPNGYGYARMNIRQEGAHRLAFLFSRGAILRGKIICHRCDEPACCNPRHLYAGTYSQNRDDMLKRERFMPIRRVMTAATARQLRQRAAKGETVSALADRFGISPRNVNFIKAGRTWKGT